MGNLNIALDLLKIRNANKLQDIAIHTAAPTDGQVLTYVSANTRYEALTPSGSESTSITVTNKSGGTLTQGQAVIWDATAPLSVTKASVANAIPVAGVISSTTIANGATGTLMVFGTIDVEVVGTPSEQTAVGMSATPGKVEDTSPAPLALVGIVVGAVSAGKVPLFVNHL